MIEKIVAILAYVSLLFSFYTGLFSLGMPELLLSSWNGTVHHLNYKVVLWQVRIGFLELPHLLWVEDMNLPLEPAQVAILSKGIHKAAAVDGCGVQADEGDIHDAKLGQLPHQICHNRLQLGVIHLTKEAVISPVGRQGPHDVKAAVMGNDTVVVQIANQICDLRKSFTFHHKKCTEHRFFWKDPPSGCRSGQRKL